MHWFVWQSTKICLCNADKKWMLDCMEGGKWTFERKWPWVLRTILSSICWVWHMKESGGQQKFFWGKLNIDNNAQHPSASLTTTATLEDGMLHRNGWAHSCKTKPKEWFMAWEWAHMPLQVAKKCWRLWCECLWQHRWMSLSRMNVFSLLQCPVLAACCLILAPTQRVFPTCFWKEAHSLHTIVGIMPNIKEWLIWVAIVGVVSEASTLEMNRKQLIFCWSSQCFQSDIS
mgnify:CR=1 FL=1